MTPPFGRRALLELALVVAASACGKQQAPSSEPPRVVRCAVIAGMMTTGLFPAVAQRFERATGIGVKVAATGNKRMIVPAMREGQVDLITLHASDAITNLVADGFAIEAEPWARNDHVIVGPADDPAGVRGLTDAAEAMRRIVAAKAPFVEHRGGGELLEQVLADARVSLAEGLVFRLEAGENQEAVLELASKKRAYSLVGRIPFQIGKLQGQGIEILVAGDARLRRPFLVAVANPKKWPGARYAEAHALAQHLRARETQAFIASFGRDNFGGRAPFEPVEVP